MSTNRQEDMSMTVIQYLNRALVALYAAATPIVATLIDSDIITPQVGVDVGVVLAVFATAWHGGQAAAAKSGVPSVQ